jgi:fluoride exporter
MKEYLFIGFGGFFGAISRGIISKGMEKFSIFGGIPIATFSVNILGCLVIGFLSIMFGKWFNVSTLVQSMVMVGFLGSFTTYSTFANQSFDLFNNLSNWQGWVNIVGHIVFGILAIYIGRTIALSIS